ncbi:MAG: hypothetical protein VXZ38_00360 [Planctomycetota bacterium]|nr:hypothetical protein [Planctomycetota bacterium]
MATPLRLTSSTRLSFQCLIYVASLACLIGANRLTFAQDNPNDRLDNTFSQGRSVEDRGSKAADSRYQLDFGLFDLSKPSHSVFHIAPLPTTRFTLGIVLPIVHPFNENRIARQNAKSNPQAGPASHNTAPADDTPEWFKHSEVAIQLIDKSSQSPVLDVSHPLSRWTWTNWGPTRGTSFLYCRDVASTSFKPENDQGYRLEVRVKTPGQVENLKTIRGRLLMTGGGWKVDSVGMPPSSFRLLRWLEL